jgi:hypothetical protein
VADSTRHEHERALQSRDCFLPEDELEAALQDSVGLVIALYEREAAASRARRISISSNALPVSTADARRLPINESIVVAATVCLVFP